MKRRAIETIEGKRLFGDLIIAQFNLRKKEMILKRRIENDPVLLAQIEVYRREGKA